MKKFFAITMLAAMLGPQALQAGIITTTITNATPSTNVISTGRALVNQIVISSATDNDVRFYDSATNSLTYVVGSFTYATNITQTLTWLTTNGIFIYPTSTNYLIQTNTYVSANVRTNVTVAGATNQYPVAAAAYAIAGVTALSDLNLVFTRGISVTTTNAATIIIYTTDN